MNIRCLFNSRVVHRDVIGAGLVVLSAASAPVFAGPGCDFNLRLNNHTPNAVAVFGTQSSASKAGLNLWNPIDGLSDAVLDPQSAGAPSHSKQAAELNLPCWTGKVDLKIRYLDDTRYLWKYRRGVKIKAGDTIQLNIGS